jgi:hypothetical protein
MTEDQIREFQLHVRQAVDYRENVLNPENRLFKLPLSIQDEEKIRIEMDILRAVVDDFEGVFDVKNLCRIKEML